MSSHARVLVVDLTSGVARVDSVDTVGLLGLGGKALGSRLLEQYLDPEVDPLHPDNIVVFTPSNIARHGISGSSRMAAFTKSPLTGIWLESYCGGSFARIFCDTGWDAVLVTGSASAPVHLHVDVDGAHLLSASRLWGREPHEVEAEILSGLGRKAAVLCIGVAGENLVRVASVMHERAHALGRGGMGAVLGSKSLKAFSVKSLGAEQSESQEQFVATRREVSKLATDSPAANSYRTYGTAMGVSVFNEVGAFPADLFTLGAAPHRTTLEAEGWPRWSKVETDSCAPCPMRCRKRLILTSGPEIGRELHGPEYETIYSFGGSCRVEHAADVARLNERCNRLGMDSISSGNLVGVCIKARELGLLPDGPDPGDVQAIDALLTAIATRSSPLGELLAEGMDKALTTLGMNEWSITSKGLDPAGYEPRRLKGMALSYAVNVRGACHLRATFYKAEVGGLLDGLDDDAYVSTYVDWEDRALLQDSLIMCRFYRDFMTWDRICSAVTQLHGAPVSKHELECLCVETVTRIRCLNFAFGLTPADDTVAERFFRDATDKAPALDKAEFERRVAIYWAKRGWTEDGRPQV